jgi:signal transduction histidine kinase
MTLEAREDELEELRASRRRLVLQADVERRGLERALHDGLHQQLIALAVNVQLARRLLDDEPAEAKALLDELGRDVHRALDEAGRLARRIYPPLLETGSLAVALRTAAAGAGVRVHVEVTAGDAYPPEVAGAVYFCWLAVLESADDGASATITVRHAEGALGFEIAGDGVASGGVLGPARDRIEALGGRLTVRPEPGPGVRVSGSLPLAR